MNRIKQVNETYLLTVAAAVAASFIITVISVVLGMRGIAIDEMIALLVSQVVLFLPTALYLWKNEFNLRETIRLKPIKFSTVFMLVGFMYAVMPAATLINAISLKFTTNVIDSTVTEIADKYPLAVGMLVVALIPAILEESVYRGVFYNEYRKVEVRKAIVLSGFLFGLTHMNFNQFIYAFLLGMVFSIVVEVTDSIVSSMVLHFVMNGTSMITIYTQKAVENIESIEMVDTAESIDAYINSGWLPAAVGLILAFFLLKIIAENERRGSVIAELFGKKASVQQSKETEPEEQIREEEYQTVSSEKLGTAALWLGITLSLGIMLLVEVTG